MDRSYIIQTAAYNDCCTEFKDPLVVILKQILMLLFLLTFIVIVAAVDLHYNGKTSSQEGQSVVDAQSLSSFLEE